MNKLFIFVIVGLLAVSTQASLVWQGGGGLFTESAWLDDDGQVPGANTIDGGTAITANTGTEKLVEITSGSTSPVNFWNNFHVNDNSLTVSGGMSLTAASSQINSGLGELLSTYAQASSHVLTVSQGSTVSLGEIVNFATISVDASTVSVARDVRTGGTGGITLSSGSSFSAQWIASSYSTINVDETSSLALTHGTDPLRNNTLNLAEGATLTLDAASLFTTEAAYIYVDGVSYADDNSILSIVGNTATAIPEPATIGLIAVMSGAILFIRRRFTI